MQFKGKTIWITGASSGIGEALAYALSKEGARLVLSARREEVLIEVRGRCERPESHLIKAMDLSDSNQIQRVAEELLGQGEAIDIIINNGGISQRSLVKDTSLDVDRRIMEVNFFGAVALTKALLPHMLERKKGHIVVMSSVLGKFSTQYRSAYAASKHAIHGYFNSLRSETWQDNLKVTIVCPGYVQTNVSVNSLTGDGSLYGQVDDGIAHGVPAEKAAQIILQGIAAGKDEILFGGKEVLGVYLNRFFPGLFKRIIKKAKVT